MGPKAPLKHYQIWRIRRYLERNLAWRDLALLSFALDSMLRSSDLLATRVGDVIDETWHTKPAVAFRQHKTGRAVQVELTPYARKAIDTWVDHSRKVGRDFLFTAGGSPHGNAISSTRYRRLVRDWVAAIDLNPDAYSTHSLRRTLPSRVYHETRNIEAVRNLLGPVSVTATSHYLNVGGQESLDLARRYRI